MADQLVSQKTDYPRWYTDVVLRAELADYSPVKGCMVIRPYGYALWEGLQRCSRGSLLCARMCQVLMRICLAAALARCT